MKIFWTIVFLAAASGASAAPIGMAESHGNFQVSKAISGKTIEVPTASIVDPGDEVTAAGEVVRVQLPRGDQVLVDRNSATKFVSDSEIALKNGNMLATFDGKSTREFSYEGLSVQGVSRDAGEQQATQAAPGILVISESDSDTVKVAGMNSDFVVVDKGQDKRLAYLGDGDAMQFHRVGEEWVLQQQQEVTSPFTAPTDVSGGALTVDVEKLGFLWWSTPIVAAGVGTGGYFLLRDLLDDDSSSGGGGGDDGGGGGGRRPFSPIYATPTPIPAP